MTSTVTYPSAVVPGPPPVHLEMPEGWLQVWAPDTLIAIRDGAQGADHFLANLVVRHTQRVAPFGPAEITAELTEQARHRRQGELGPATAQDIAAREWTRADLAFVDPQAGPVTQTHWFSGVQHGEVVDVLQVTGFYGSRREADAATIEEIVGSLRIGP